MNVHQLSIAYVPDQDRILARVNTKEGRELQFWFTRRLTLGLSTLMDKVVTDHVARQAGVAEARLADMDDLAKKAVSQFQRSENLKSADFSTPYKAPEASVPLFASPLLVTEINIAPLANGHADPARSLPHERPAGIPPGYVRNGHAPQDAPANSGAPGAAAGEAMPRIVPQQAGSRPVREPSNPLRDMEALVDFVRRSDVQHKTALIELLAVVEDYLKGGSTVRDDAVAHWQSFAGYAHQYLAAVDGLLPLTDRAGRPFAVH